MDFQRTRATGLMQSLPPHLESRIGALLAVLPPSSPEHGQLNIALASEEEDKTIPYALLRSLSTFATNNADLLESHSLKASDYTMIALLAGTKSDPKTRFPPPRPKEKDVPWSKTTRELTTILNCVFSVLGTGAAAWYATDRTGWRTELVSAS
jgi:TMEM199 family protein